MWGNSTGWTISACLTLAFCVAIFAVQKIGTATSGMTPAFASQASQMHPIALPIAPETIVSMDEACDAAPAYRQVVREYEDHEFEYENAPLDTLRKYKAADRLIEAAHCRDLTLFSASPEQVINFDSEKGPIKALRRIGDITVLYAMTLHAKGDLDAAQKYAQSAFALGEKLYHERVVYDELEAGLGLMGSAGKILARIASARNDATRAARIEQFDDARKKFSGRDGPLQELRVLTRNIDGDISGSRAGDIFYLAQKSPERMWRIEACFQLARIHRNVGDQGKAADQRHAQQLLRDMADHDPDPIVRLAAMKARDVTDAEYRKQ